MNNEQYDRVLAACRAQQAKGVVIRTGLWGVAHLEGRWIHTTIRAGKACSCALGCLLMEEQPAAPAFTGNWLIAKVALKCSFEELNALVSGFDGSDYRPEEHDLDWFQAGVRLARELGVAE